MRAFLEKQSQDSCLNKAKPDEPIFVLLGRDHSAPVAIRVWIENRIKTGKNQHGDRQIIEAEQLACMMETEWGTW